MVLDPGLLGNAVEPDSDPVQDAARLDLDQPGLAVERERHGEDGLQRVALLAAGRADIGGATAGAAGKVERTLDRLGRDAGAVVADLDQLLGDGDLDPRRQLRLLGIVERVVGQLLDDDERPAFGRVADLARQLALAQEVERPRGTKNLGDESAHRFTRPWPGAPRPTSRSMAILWLCQLLHASRG